MKTWTKLALAFAGAGAVVAWVLVDSDERDARLTAKGTAIVTAIEVKRDVESRSLDETRFQLRLQAGGNEVDTEATLPGDRAGEFGEGQTLTVCYNPNEPKEADIELDPAVQCGA